MNPSFNYLSFYTSSLFCKHTGDRVLTPLEARELEAIVVKIINIGRKIQTYKKQNVHLVRSVN